VVNLSNKSLILRPSTSVQRQHTRIVKTKTGKRSIVINKGNLKPVIQSSTKKSKINPSKSISRRRARVPVKQESKSLQSISLKKKEVVRLERDQHYATRIIEMSQSSPMSAAGMITIEMKDGSQKTFMMEFRSSMAQAINILYEKLERKEPVLIALSEWGEFLGIGKPDKNVEYKEWNEA
jgi:hypothetical protein